MGEAPRYLGKPGAVRTPRPRILLAIADRRDRSTRQRSPGRRAVRNSVLSVPSPLRDASGRYGGGSWLAGPTSPPDGSPAHQPRGRAVACLGSGVATAN